MRILYTRIYDIIINVTKCVLVLYYFLYIYKKIYEAIGVEGTGIERLRRGGRGEWWILINIKKNPAWKEIRYNNTVMTWAVIEAAGAACQRGRQHRGVIIRLSPRVYHNIILSSSSLLLSLLLLLVCNDILYKTLYINVGGGGRENALGNQRWRGRRRWGELRFISTVAILLLLLRLDI